jgi:hypothetical protein
MDNLNAAVKKYKAMLESGENIALIELFYDDEIVQVENSEAPVTGKSRLLAQEISNLQGVTWCKQQISNIIVDEASGLVMGEMLIIFNSKKLGLKKLEQAFVQRWKGQKIQYQRFYYKAFIDCNE